MILAIFFRYCLRVLLDYSFESYYYFLSIIQQIYSSAPSSFLLKTSSMTDRYKAQFSKVCTGDTFFLLSISILVIVFLEGEPSSDTSLFFLESFTLVCSQCSTLFMSQMYFTQLLLFSCTRAVSLAEEQPTTSNLILRGYCLTRLSNTNTYLFLALLLRMQLFREIQQCVQSSTQVLSLIWQFGPLFSPFCTFMARVSNYSSFYVKKWMLLSFCLSIRELMATQQQLTFSSMERERKDDSNQGLILILRYAPHMVVNRLKDQLYFLMEFSIKLRTSLTYLFILMPLYSFLDRVVSNLLLSSSLLDIYQIQKQEYQNSSHSSTCKMGFVVIGLIGWISRLFYKIMSEQKKSLFGNYFNLHPQDAYLHVESLVNALESFTNAFKERIQVEIDYSKSLLKVGKKLEKYINPQEPTPLSYISSAFKVEHEQRARHALELAQYLHTEIEVPCEEVLAKHQEELKRIERDLKKFYREGELVEQSYQKSLKKFYRTRQDWQERMMAKSILNFTPGTTLAQKQKAQARLQEDRRENEQHHQKYLQSLRVFNQFAQRYNKAIWPYLVQLQEVELDGLTQQSDSIRKLIVSEVNMFKNIEYDLLNISKQMQSITPNSQIECFVVSRKDVFEAPIISIYSQGPIVPNRYELVDCKYPIKRTLLEETLLRIDSSLFTWQLQNKSNSTIRYAVERLLKRYEESEAGDNDFLEQLENTINTNQTVRQIPLDGVGKNKYLNVEEVYSLCLEIVSGIAQFLKAEELYEHKIKSLIQLFESCFSLHHFYRFIGLLALDEYSNLHDQMIAGKITTEHYVVLIRLLLDKSAKTNDIFVTRSILPLLFSARFVFMEQQRFYFQHQSIQDLDIWMDRDFWQAALFEETYELITQLPSSMERTELKDVYLMRQKNVVFSGLLTYCHYMIMLGVQVSQTRLAMARICQIYNLYEEHERDIAKTIAQQYKKYKSWQE